MKKIIALTLSAIALICCLAGCGAKTIEDIEPTVMEQSDASKEATEAVEATTEESVEAASEASLEELLEEEAVEASSEVSAEASSEEASAESSEEEADLSIGKTNGNVYENQFFNLKFTLPTGYTFVDDETLAKVSGNLANYAGENAEKVQKAVDEGTTVVAAFATDSNGINNVSIAIQGNAAIQNALVSEKSLLTLSQQQVKSSIESQGATVKDITVEEKTIAGDSHYTLKVEGDIQGISFYEELITIQKGNYVLLFTVTNVNEDDTADFISAIEKLN